MAKIIRRFIDRNTKKLIDLGEYEVSAEREAELIKAGVAEDKAKEAAGKDIEELKVAEIKALLDEKEIKYDSKAKRSDLLALLEKTNEEQEAE